MATRNRTALFVQYRNSFGRPKKYTDYKENEKIGLIKQDVIIEMANIPPKWIEIVHQIEEEMKNISELVTKLENVYKRHVLPGFDDRQEQEQSIEQLSNTITRSFQISQKKIKSICKNENEKLGKNIQIALATKLSDLSKQFRLIQSDYIKKLKNRQANAKNIFDFEKQEEFIDKGFNQKQVELIQENEEKILEREKEINEISKSIFSLAEIFKDLQTMIIAQGSVLDRIDYNIDLTVVQMKTATVELEKGTEYQKKAGKKMIILLLILIVFAMLLAVIFR